MLGSARLNEFTVKAAGVSEYLCREHTDLGIFGFQKSQEQTAVLFSERFSSAACIGYYAKDAPYAVFADVCGKRTAFIYTEYVFYGFFLGLVVKGIVILDYAQVIHITPPLKV